MFYSQLYNVARQANTGLPKLDLSYQLVAGETLVEEMKDSGGNRAVYVSDARIALLEYLNLAKAGSGPLTLRIHVVDHLSGQSLTLQKPIRLEKGNP